MTEQHDSTFELPRRTFVKGVGAAGAAGAVGATTGQVMADIPEENLTSVGSGAFATAIPDGFDYQTPPDPTYVTENAAPPYPTNDWWSGLLFGVYSSGPVAGLPYHATAGPAGLTVKHPTDWAGEPESLETVVSDYAGTPGLTIGHAGVSEFADARVDDWGDWHVTTRWGAGSDATLDLTVARGLPLFFAEYAGGSAELVLETHEGDAASESQVSVFADRGNVLGVTVSANGYDKHFGVFAPADATWSGTGTGTLTSDLAGAGYLTVAVLPDDNTATLDDFEAVAYNFVTGTTVDWDYVESEGGTPVSEVRTTYTFETDSKAESTGEGTLTCLFPHQWKFTDAALIDHDFWSPRGTMKAVQGTSFTTTKTYDGILPFTPTEGTGDDSTLEGYVSRLESEYPRYTFGVPRSAYWVGKDLFRNCTVSALADQTGQSDAHDYFLSATTDRMESWLDAGDTAQGTEDGQELFVYDDALGSLFEFPAEFGAVTAVNDHHFHYGYFVYAAAEAARAGEDWAATENWGGMVDRLVRDYANWERPDHSAELDPASDPKNAFPFLRNFDVYGGHSWAGGTVGNPKGNNQESSSEAVMSYAAMIRWGELTGNDALRDAGIYLYTQETHSVWEYWFDPEDDSHPENWGDSVSTLASSGPDFEYAANVWGAGYWRLLWWQASDPVEIYGINWLPVGPHSHYLARDLGYVHANWSDMVDARRDISGMDDPTAGFLGGWEPTALSYRAFSDPGHAADLVDEQLPVGPGGNSSAFTYNFVHFLEMAGKVDTDVVADAPFYRVFEDGQQRTYVAYNAGDEERTVAFSDGTELSVPSGESVVHRSAENYAPDTTPPTKPGDLSAADTTSFGTTLSWTDATDEGSTVQYYRVLSDGIEYDTVTDTSVRVENLSKGVTHTLSVEAVDTLGNVSARATVEVTADSEDTAPPRAPAGLTVQKQGREAVTLTWEAASDVGSGTGLDHYVVYVDGEAHSETADPGLEVTGLSPETRYALAVTAVDAAGNESARATLSVTTLAAAAAQGPYDSAHTVPGRITAVDFDNGGEGVSFHDTTEGNSGGAYRDTRVDIEASATGGHNLGWTTPGEWWEYTVQVESAGTYPVQALVASANGGGSFYVSVDGEQRTEEFSFDATGGWQAWRTKSVGEVELTEGEHVIRVTSTAAEWNLKWLQIGDTGGQETPTPTKTPSPTATPTATPASAPETAASAGTPASGAETTTSGDGPGFGALTTLAGLALLGVRLLVSDDAEE